MTTGITSYGYSPPGGVITPNVGWAKWQKCAGARYMVDSPDDCVITPVSGGIQVGPGILGGQGILDEVDSSLAVVPWSPPGSGTQYALLVATRDWSASTPQTSFRLQTVGSSLPSSMAALTNTSPGVKDDQPLGLLSLASNDVIPRLVKDLRAIGGPNFYVMQPGLDQNWFGYMTQPGVTIYSGNITWRRLLDPSSGNEIWDQDPEIVRAGPGFGNPLDISNNINDGTAAGWKSVAVLECRGSRTVNDMKLLFQINHYSSSNPLTFTGGSGNVVGGDMSILSVGNTDWRPPYDIPAVAFTYRAGDNSTYTGHGTYTVDGQFKITDGVQGTSIGVRSDGTWSIRALVNWTREG